MVMPMASASRRAKGVPLTSMHLGVGVACLLAVPVATWFLLGDMSEPGGMDRIYSAPDAPRPVEIFLGAMAAGALAVGLMFLIPRTRHSAERAWWPVFGVLAVVGFLLAYGLRIMPARVGGANIGGGLFLMFGLPTLAVLVAWALLRAWNLSSPPRDS